MSDVAATIDIQQIADIAKVGRSAVGNWRKRHADFPVPDSKGRFELRQIERWLIENGKIDTRVSPTHALWPVADELRGQGLSHRDATNLLVACLVYLEACERGRTSTPASRGVSAVVADESQWSAVRDTVDAELHDALLRAATSVERSNEPLDGLLVSALERASMVRPALLRSVLDSLELATDDFSQRFDLLEQVISREVAADRFRGQFSTPGDLAELMVRLGGLRSGTVFDPACGEGGLLLLAAVGSERDYQQPVQLTGVDLVVDTVRTARSRFFLHDVPVDFRVGDAFQNKPPDRPKADLVLVDPPLGLSNWGDADIYLDGHWEFGVPPPKSGDLAWVQLALGSLRPTGRAIVATTVGTTFRSGREADIRMAMIHAGVVEAIILLPGRFRSDTSVQLALWILRPSQKAQEAILMINATTLGSAGRSLHLFDEGDIERIVSALHRFRSDPGRVSDNEIAKRIEIDNIIGGDLNPAHYSTAEAIDVDALRAQVVELRAEIAASADGVATAVARVLDNVGQGGSE